MTVFGNVSDPEDKQARDMWENLRVLEELATHPGWQLLKTYLENDLRGVLGALNRFEALDGEKALKAAVAFSILSRVKDLPETLISQLNKSLAPQKESVVP